MKRLILTQYVLGSTTASTKHFEGFMGKLILITTLLTAQGASALERCGELIDISGLSSEQAYTALENQYQRLVSVHTAAVLKLRLNEEAIAAEGSKASYVQNIKEAYKIHKDCIDKINMITIQQLDFIK